MAENKHRLNDKYKRVRAGRQKANHEDGFKTRRYFRLQALRDIPEHNVKAGDFGGYVTKEVKLSHGGSCWIGEQAQVIGHVEIKDDAYIGGKATVFCKMPNSQIIVSDQARIFENARIVTYTSFLGFDPMMKTLIKDQAQVFGDASCESIFEISGTSKVYGSSRMREKVKIQGESEVYDKAHLSHESVIIDTVIHGSAVVGKSQRLINGAMDKTEIHSAFGFEETEERPNPSTYLPKDGLSSAKPLELNPAVSEPVAGQENVSLLAEIKGNIASYESDIVKLIKYPAMVDQSVPETLAMTVVLKKADRLSYKPTSNEFKEVVEELEQKFLIAESNAIKMAATMLSEEQLRKTERVKDLLSLASNEVSTEHEKKIAFKQAFKQLEGIIVVPEIAMDTFRIKIGLKEIEA